MKTALLSQHRPPMLTPAQRKELARLAAKLDIPRRRIARMESGGRIPTAKK